jgi:hypothetical protein
MSVWETVVDRIREVSRPEDSVALERFRVTRESPLRLSHLSSDLALEEGEDDVVLSDTFRQYRETYGLAAGTVVSVFADRDEYLVLDAATEGEVLDLTLGGPPSGPATGDLTDDYPDPTVAKIRGKNVPAPAAPEDGKGFVYDHGSGGMLWTDLRSRANHTGTQLASTISDLTEAVQDVVGAFFLDSASVDVTYDDVVNAISTVVINNAIDNTKLADMAQSTIKGRAAGAGTGDPTDLTAAQVKTLLALTAADISNLGAAQTYTPVLDSTGTAPTLGTGGAIAGRYIQIGKLVKWSVIIIIGTGFTAGTGTYRVSLPVTLASGYHGMSLFTGIDVGTQWYTGFATLRGNLDTARTHEMLLTSNAVGPTNWHGTSPFTPVANDAFFLDGCYEAA